MTTAASRLAITRGLIVTADDFGSAMAINEAVERGYRDGILTAASLMVGGEAASDAVARARRMPGLGVGLHIVLTDGFPLLAADRVPGLVGPDGRFHNSMLRTSLAIALSRPVRAQMRDEIVAQFAAFAATGLPLDHVNAHKHFHLHPMIASAILDIGSAYGLRAVRVPLEQGSPLLLRWWAGFLSRRVRGRGLLANDQVVGLRWSGRFGRARMRQAAGQLRPGLTEMYCHPATDDQFPGHCPGYRYRDELAALLDVDVASALGTADVRRGKFLDFACGGGDLDAGRMAA